MWQPDAAQPVTTCHTRPKAASAAVPNSTHVHDNAVLITLHRLCCCCWLCWCSVLSCLQQGRQSNSRGGPFAVVNGALACDALVVAVPADAKLQQPLQLLHVSTCGTPNMSSSNGSGAQLAASAARLLVSLGANASCEVIEEYVTAAAAAAGSAAHVSIPVAEVVIGEGAELKHGYVHREAAGAQHFKATLVSQVGWRHPVVDEAWPGLLASRLELIHRAMAMWYSCVPAVNG